MAEKAINPAFRHRQYLFRRKVLKLFGGAFHVYDENGNVLFYSKQKAFMNSRKIFEYTRTKVRLKSF